MFPAVQHKDCHGKNRLAMPQLSWRICVSIFWRSSKSSGRISTCLHRNAAKVEGSSTGRWNSWVFRGHEETINFSQFQQVPEFLIALSSLIAVIASKLEEFPTISTLQEINIHDSPWQSCCSTQEAAKGSYQSHKTRVRSSGHPRNCSHWIDWFKGKFTGNPYI